MSKQGYYIGLDGGGTRTVAMLADAQGRVQAFHRATSTNYHVVGEEKARQTMFSIFDALLLEAGVPREQLAGVCLGLSGCDRPEDRTLVGSWVDAYEIGERTCIVNDAVIALAGGTPSGVGMLVISGTGSIFFARDAQGRTRRVGGWGPLLADEASGYHLGREALRAIMRTHDGHEPPTALTAPILESLGLRKPDDLVRWSTTEGLIKDRVAALSRHVFAAAEAGDPAAEEIIDRLTRLAAKMVSILASLTQLGETYEVVLAGGNFKHSDLYFNRTRDRILELLPSVQVVRPRMQPVAGAVLVAMAESGHPPDAEVAGQIQATFPEPV